MHKGQIKFPNYFLNIKEFDTATFNQSPLLFVPSNGECNIRGNKIKQIILSRVITTSPGPGLHGDGKQMIIEWDHREGRKLILKINTTVGRNDTTGSNMGAPMIFKEL